MVRPFFVFVVAVDWSLETPVMQSCRLQDVGDRLAINEYEDLLSIHVWQSKGIALGE